MATKSDPTAGKQAKGRSPRKSAAPAAPEPAHQPGGAKRLLRAGLKALNEVRDDVITRQSRVFEALLGIDTSKSKLLKAGESDAAGMQKFEEIFDQRVARSLERLGMPSPQALAALCQQLEAINDHLKRIAPAPPKRPARRPPTRP
jgi:hypothetical protein